MSTGYELAVALCKSGISGRLRGVDHATVRHDAGTPNFAAIGGVAHDSHDILSPRAATCAASPLIH
jgi:hypothetical protein